MNEIIVRNLGKIEVFESIDDLEIALSRDYMFKHIALSYKLKSGVLKNIYGSVNKDGKLKETYGCNKDINLREFLFES